MLKPMLLRYLIAVLCMMTLPLMAQGHGGCADGEPSAADPVSAHAAAPQQHSDPDAGDRAVGEHAVSNHATSDHAVIDHDCGDCDTLCLIKCSTASALTVSVLQWHSDTVDIFFEQRHFPPLSAHTSPLLRPPSLRLA
ncbi:hypothetical protein K8B33_09490 [Alcanivorax sp. JB21]|uniref:hypothetical protein n=1 Tax=Alcanivorax limicola TaxID=2874102 RepID=UPI001CC02450|nr:hypothetical protein [Alcanivorax limicola]MBZ2189330.1 hypothetical protein [Alcanivorax limicola]